MSAASAPGKETEPSPSSSENCVICLDPISERVVASPCQHAFDYLCLLKWLEVRQSCPLCNSTVNVLSVVNKTLGRVVKHPVEPPKTQTSTPTPTPTPPHPPSTSRPHHRRREPTPPPPVSETTSLLRRRFVYTHHLRSSHIGSNRISRFRHNPTPSQFHHDAELVSRARTFIRRELQVFQWIAADGNDEFLLEYIIAILKSVDLRGASGAAEDMIADFLGRENARVFIHELYAWLRSPFGRLADFDSFAQYAMPVPREFSRRDEEALRVEEGDEGDGEELARDRVGRAPRNRDKGPRRKGPYDKGGRDSHDRERGYDSYRPGYSRA